DHAVLDVDLRPVAVELDLVNPARAARHFIDRGRQRRLDEARVPRPGADVRGFIMLQRHAYSAPQQTHAAPAETFQAAIGHCRNFSTLVRVSKKEGGAEWQRRRNEPAGAVSRIVPALQAVRITR